MKPPPCWQAFWTWLAMPAPLQQRLWHAVSTSPSPTVRSWYYTILYYQPKPQDPRYTTGFIFGTLGPQRVIETLEVLVVTKGLTRREATTIEEYILKWTNTDGRWA